MQKSLIHLQQPVHSACKSAVPALQCLLLILLGLSSGCRKDMNYQTQISGVVLERISGKRIVGATVILAKAPASAIGAYAYQTVAVSTTDANGSYAFNFTAEPNMSYTLAARCAPYFDSDWFTPTIGQSNQIHIPMDPPSFIKFHVKNIHSSLHIDTYGSSAYSKSFVGTSIDTTFVSGAILPGSQTIYWDVWNSANVQLPQQTGQVSTAAFDTVPFTITY